MSSSCMQTLARELSLHHSSLHLADIHLFVKRKLAGSAKYRQLAGSTKFRQLAGSAKYIKAAGR